MKACGLVGSPVKGGNVDILVGRVLEGASSCGAITEKLFLNDLAIRPCQSCGPRRPKESLEFCRFEDDMEQVFEALQASDVVVLGSPVYFDTVSAQTKLMIDRCNCLTALVDGGGGTMAFEKRLKRRKAGVFVAVAGTEQDFGPIRATAEGFFAWINADLIESVLYGHEGNEKGTVRNDPVWMRKAFEAGARAASRSGSP